MIVRDEERHLPACLASLRGVVDEVVIVDTGSVDATVALAEAQGARVLRRPWSGDFSAPRNLALENVTGQWVLYVDADERVRPLDRRRLAEMLEAADEVAFRVLLHPFERATAYREYRLWRNDSRIRFRGVIHEKVVYAIREVAQADGRSIGDCGVTLDHVGYDGDQRAKHERNLPLLQAQLAAEPDNVFNWRHLARVLMALGRSEEAEAALESAVALIRSREVPYDHASLAWAELVRMRHGAAGLLGPNAVADVTALLSDGLARWPDNWLLAWIEGQVHQGAGRHEDAIDCFERLLRVDVDALPGTGVAYDERLFGSYAHAARALSLFRLGRYAAAADAYAAAEQLEPESVEYVEYGVKRRLAESRVAAGHCVQATQAGVASCVAS